MPQEFQAQPAETQPLQSVAHAEQSAITLQNASATVSEPAATEEEVTALLETMDRETKRQSNWTMAVVISYFVLFELLCIGFISPLPHIQPHAYFRQLLIFAPLAFIFGSAWFALSKYFLRHVNGQKRRQTVSRLVALHDKRMVGPLCDALGFPDKEIRKQTERALIELLPTLQATDASLLQAVPRLHLHLALSRKKPEFTLAALKALKQIGNKDSLPAVQNLIARCDDPEDRAVREAAEECLLFLQTQEARSRDTLLRASGMTTPPDVLLRPSQDQPPTPAEELLRPSKDT